MQVTITAKNLELGDSLRDYVESKSQRLDRFLTDIDEARIELDNQSTRSPEHSQVAQITLYSKGTVLRTEERSADMRSSIDIALDKMVRQLRRFKGKQWSARARRQGNAAPVEEFEDLDEPETETIDHIVRIKRFGTRPMDVDEAIEQMELLEHDFFIFYNMSEGGFNVVYRRYDGGYGLLIPELS
jgi:putative sigma-54 modulation protein